MELNEKIIEDYRKKSRLNDDEYEVYLNSVIEKFTNGKRRCDNPVAIYVAGQTGAGKSNLVNLVIQGFSNKDNVVICNFDIIKTMHPKYTNICNIPEIVHDVLMPDAGRLIEDFTKYCRENRFNIITEGTMKCTSEAIDLLENFKKDGYYVELDILSVPKFESYGSILFRYAENMEKERFPRLVPNKVHEESFSRLLITLDELTKRGLYDNINVYRRGSENENYVPARIYSLKEQQFYSAIDAVNFGRQQYRQRAINAFPQMYSKVENIFRTKAPDKLTLLKDWRYLYEEEKNQLSLRDMEHY